MNNRERQVARELQSVETGKEQFLEVVADTDHKRELARDAVLLKAWEKNIEPLAEAIEKHFAAVVVSRGINNDYRGRIRELFSVVPPAEAAAAVLQYCLRYLYVNETKLNYASVCRPAAGAVIHQYNYKKFVEALPTYAQVVAGNQARHAEHRAAVFQALEKKHETPSIDFDDKERIILGGALLHLVVSATGLFAFREAMDQKKKKITMMFQPTEKFKDWLEDTYEYFGQLQPVDVPMVCEPEDWTGLYTGGFLTNAERLAHRPIIRTINKELRNSAFDRTSPEVLEALNRLQKMPWAINTFILETVDSLSKAKSDLGGLPCVPKDVMVDEAGGPEPWQLRGVEKSVYEQMTESDKKLAKEYREWKHARARAYTRFHDEASMRAVLRTQLAVAEELKDEAAIYFCYSMDWRGRVYVQQNCGLDPQANDVGKALLVFAEGKELGERGLFWLKVHAANCFGFDKAAFSDRAKWADENLEGILASGEAPLDYRWWAEADKPFQFLAACRELSLAVKSGSPETFVSRLPIAMDASCSGSQHYSAMLRDPVGGTAVNLVPGAAPGDIYRRVAEKAIDLMAGHVLGNEWLYVHGGEAEGTPTFNRKWTKRNTMTFPYSASLYGFTDQLLDEVRKDGKLFKIDTIKPAVYDEVQKRVFETRLKEWYATPPKKRGPKPTLETTKVSESQYQYHMCRYLAITNSEAISQVVVKMFDAMVWLQSTVGIFSETGKDIEWTTPVGLKVVQRYRKSEAKRMKLMVGDVQYWPQITRATDKPNIDGHKNGISPNFIHSLDAAHLMKVVLDYGRMGKCLGVVHDSFSTHACNVDLMRDVIRETFIRIYADTNILAGLRAQLQAANPDLELPPMPEQGALDVNAVRDSEYFIS